MSLTCKPSSLQCSLDTQTSSVPQIRPFTNLAMLPACMHHFPIDAIAWLPCNLQLEQRYRCSVAMTDQCLPELVDAVVCQKWYQSCWPRLDGFDAQLTVMFFADKRCLISRVVIAPNDLTQTILPIQLWYVIFKTGRPTRH